jgi:hypothetical protein
MISPTTVDVIAFYTREALVSHALLDRIKVPKEVNGEKLSLSQRVNIAVGTVEGLMRRFGMDWVEPTQ